MIKITSTSISKTDGTAWASVDVDALQEDTFQAYKAYKEANELARAAREEFEAMFRIEAGTDGIRFGYNYGKLSFAKGQPKAEPKAKVSLDEFLAGRLNGGHAV